MFSAVALLTEGVDRNVNVVFLAHVQVRVALLTEGVDRNSSAVRLTKSTSGRPPHGGRR